MKIVAILFFLCCLFFTLQSCFTFKISDKKAKRYFKSAGVIVTFKNIINNRRTLHYVQTGNNNFPTLIFVHGTPGSWSGFKTYLKDSLLLTQFRLVAIDRPGFGASNFGEALNLEEQSILISPILDSLTNGQPLYLVGHSFGGPMICKLAADNPTKIAALVILAGSQDPAAEKAEKWRPILFKTPLNYLVPCSLSPSNKELWYLKKDLVKLKDELNKIICPVYLMHGTKDKLVPFSNVAYTKKMLINVSRLKVIEFENENHFIPWTKFEEIRNELLTLTK